MNSSLFSVLVTIQSIPAAGGHPPTPETIWQTWTWDPLVLAGLALSLLLYGRGLLRLRRRTGALHRGHKWRSVAFVAGLLVIAVALISPVDGLGSALLSAHMVQHVLLIAAAAPLLAFSQPLGPLLLGLPRPRGTRLDQQVGRWWHRQQIGSILWRWLSHPFVAWTLYAVVLWIWHLPALYQAAIRVEWIHALEHVAFLAAALLLWWIVAEHSRRTKTDNWLLPIGLLFTTAIHSGVLGMLMTFSAEPWYPIYGVTTRAWGLTPLADQQLAGALMWVPPGFVYLSGALIFLYRLIEETGRKDDLLKEGKRSATGLFLVIALVGLSSCFTGPPRTQTSFLVPEGDPQRGWYAVQEHGCPACHTIPGVPGANTQVGPPLTDWAKRRYIAGSLVNVPANLILWIQYPQEIEPGTAMPNIPMTDQDARDMAAFLYTLGYEGGED